MMHATTNLDARADVRKWLPVLKATLRLSQNGFAREARLDPSILSRWLNEEIESPRAEKKARRALARLKRRVVVDEKAS